MTLVLSGKVIVAENKSIHRRDQTHLIVKADQRYICDLILTLTLLRSVFYPVDTCLKS